MAAAPPPATPGCSTATTAGGAPPACISRASATWVASEDKFKRGYGYEVYTNRGTWTRGVDGADFGADFKNEITRPGEWQLYMEGYGETLAYHDNRMWLSKDLDPLGMPKIHVSMSYRDNERAMAQQMMDDAVEMMTAARLENVRGFNHPVTPGSVIHEMGTARMGRDPKTSGAERAQPGARGAQSVRDRRQLHGVLAHAKPFAHVHGADGACRQLRGGSAQEERDLTTRARMNMWVARSPATDLSTT